MNKTFADLPPLTPADADVVPAQQDITGTTYRTTWADVFLLLLSGSNTFTVGPQAVVSDDAAHACLILQVAAAASAAPFQVFDSSGTPQVQIAAALDRIVFNPSATNDRSFVKGTFATVALGGGAAFGNFLEAAVDGVSINSGVLQSQTDGGALTVRCRTAGGLDLDGGALSLHGADAGSGGSGDHDGGGAMLYGGAKHGAGDDGDVFLLWTGSTGRGKLRIGNSIASATGPVGSVVAKLPLYDETGSLVGYLPLYDAIT
jgi:hypothetical protein